MPKEKYTVISKEHVCGGKFCNVLVRHRKFAGGQDKLRPNSPKAILATCSVFLWLGWPPELSGNLDNDNFLPQTNHKQTKKISFVLFCQL